MFEVRKAGYGAGHPNCFRDERRKKKGGVGVITINQNLTPAARKQQRKEGVEIYRKEIRRGWTRKTKVFGDRPKEW